VKETLKKVIRLKNVTVCAAVAVLILLLSYLASPHFYAYNEHSNVTITGLGIPGAENPDGLRAVYLLGITINNEPLDLSTIELSPGWIYRDYVFDGVLFFESNNPHSLEITFTPGLVSIEFRSHPWSGWVQVESFREVYEFDLFTPEMEAESIFVELQVQQKRVYYTNRIIIFLILAFFFCIIVSALTRLSFYLRQKQKCLIRNDEISLSMTENTDSCYKNRLEGALHHCAVIFMPSILLFELYNRNRIQNHIPFMHTLITAAILAAASIILFNFLRRVTRTLEGSLLVTLLFWLMFWLFEQTYSVVLNFFTTIPRLLLWIALMCVLAFIVIILRWSSLPFYKIRIAFHVLSVALCVIFILNITPALQHQSALRTMHIEPDVALFIKKDFNIDPNLPTPNIYWIHLDGVMSMETVERFWGTSQNQLRDMLTNRGFMIYEDARIYSSDTMTSLAALLSPAFYDNFWGERMAQSNTKFRDARLTFLSHELMQVGLTLEGSISPYFEFLSAFVTRGYRFYQDFPDNHFYPVIPMSFADQTHEHGYTIRPWHRIFAQSGDLATLLTLTTPLSIPPSEAIIAFENRRIARGSNLEYLPRLTWKSFFEAHVYSGMWIVTFPQFGHPVSSTIYDAYPYVFDYVMLSALNYVDQIIAENPNAVIILQADHGLHSQLTHEHLMSIGYDHEQILELIHSIFSAVRIPPQYGGLDAPLAPLNISRELVNRFVGENYTLLP